MGRATGSVKAVSWEGTGQLPGRSADGWKAVGAAQLLELSNPSPCRTACSHHSEHLPYPRGTISYL